MKKILIDALKAIKPTKEEEREVLNRVDSILSRINKRLVYAKAVLGGSGAKGTWLKDVNDADIFVCFDYKKYKDKDKTISDILEKVLEKEFKNVDRLYGSRDYFQIKQKNFTFEMVPILAIKKAEEAKNITDVSPLHAKWVGKYKKLADEIRLTKQFCKAADVYGAESYIKGFSGYVCEILTIYYGGFLSLMRNAAKWKEKATIDPENYYKNRDILDEMNKSKTNSPLVIIDPVQADRNAAAALGKEKFDRFKSSCKNFLKKPSKSFFEIKEITTDSLKKKAKNKELMILEVNPKTGKVDVVGSKLLKSLEFLNKKLAEWDFKIIECGWEWNKKDKALFYFILDKAVLPPKKIHIGPPIKAKNHVESFKKKYKETFISKGRVYARIKREFRKPKELIIKLISDPYLKEKAEKVKIIV